MTKPVAIVVGVGAERGLGAALCRRFAAEGHHVLVAGRTPDKVAQVVRTIAAAGGSAAAAPIDATHEEDVARLFNQADEALDLVVFNAGNNVRADFRQVSAAQFEELWRIGCFAGFLVGREAAWRLVPLGRSTVIFTGASDGERLAPRRSQLRRPRPRVAREGDVAAAALRAPHAQPETRPASWP